MESLLLTKQVIKFLFLYLILLHFSAKQTEPFGNYRNMKLCLNRTARSGTWVCNYILEACTIHCEAFNVSAWPPSKSVLFDLQWNITMHSLIRCRITGESKWVVEANSWKDDQLNSLLFWESIVANSNWDFSILVLQYFLTFP